MELVKEHAEAEAQHMHWSLLGMQADRGVVKASRFNAYQLLSQHPAFLDKIRWDEFEQALKVRDFGFQISHWEEPEIVWNDSTTTEIAIWAASEYEVDFSNSHIEDAAKTIGQQNRFNGCLEMIEKEKWDRIPRIDTFLEEYLGVKADTFNASQYMEASAEAEQGLFEASKNRKALIRAYSRKLFLGAMARLKWAKASRPIKVDTCLALYGEQGLGKSQTLRALCPRPKYFGGTPLDMSSKEAVQKIQSKLIYELCELAKRSKDISTEKAFLSEDVDLIRLPYQRSVSKLPRRCIFVATTNRVDLLKDATGNRRWWPVVAGETFEKGQKIDILAIREVAPQLWAEAAYILSPKPQGDFMGPIAPPQIAVERQLSGYEKFIWWLTPDDDAWRVE